RGTRGIAWRVRERPGVRQCRGAVRGPAPRELSRLPAAAAARRRQARSRLDRHRRDEPEGERLRGVAPHDRALDGGGVGGPPRHPQRAGGREPDLSGRRGRQERGAAVRALRCRNGQRGCVHRRRRPLPGRRVAGLDHPDRSAAGPRRRRPGDPGAKGQLRQLTLGLNSRGLSLGYQRDLFSSGRRGHTYKLGYAAGHGGLAAGFATALYRGGTSGTGWDVGILYDWTPALSIGGVIRNIGQPVVRDSTLHLTYVPSVTLQLAGRRIVLSALSRLTSDGVAGYGFGLRGTLRAGTSLPIGLLARLD